MFTFREVTCLVPALEALNTASRHLPEAEDHELTSKPYPLPDPTSVGFWALTKRSKLSIEVCTKCFAEHFPPVAVCPDCAGTNLKTVEVCGRGTVRSLTRSHISRVPGYEESLPFVIATIELDDHPRVTLTTNLVGTGALGAAIGDQVEVVFEERSGYHVPQFTPVPK